MLVLGFIVLGGKYMSIEIGLLIVIILALIGLVTYMIVLERERKRRQDLWEIEVYDLIDKGLKKLDLLQGQVSKTLVEELVRVDENMQKRHNYLKKSYNDLADRIDVVEQTNKGVKDLYYQFERIHSVVNEVVALMPKTPASADEQENEPDTQVQVLDEDVAMVLQMYRQGMAVEDIAQALSKAVPEIQLTLHIFSEQT